jgi:hypothetical protein
MSDARARWTFRGRFKRIDGSSWYEWQNGLSFWICDVEAFWRRGHK